MKHLILVFLILPFSLFAQEKIASLQGTGGTSFINLAEGNTIMWLHDKPSYPSKKKLREANLQIAHLKDGVLQWSKSVIRDKEYYIFDGKVAATEDANYTYMMFEKFFYPKKEKHSFMLTQFNSIGESFSETYTIDDDMQGTVFMFCDDNYLNIVYNTYYQIGGDKEYLEKWHPRIARIHHETGAYSTYDLNLELDKNFASGAWTILKVQDSTMYFSSKTIDYKKGTVIDSILVLNTKGEVVSKRANRVEFNTAIVYGEWINSANIHHGHFNQLQDYIDMPEIARIKSLGRNFHVPIPLNSFYDWENDRIYYFAMHKNAVKPDVKLIITTLNGKVISEVSDLQLYPGEGQVGENTPFIADIDAFGNFYYHDFRKLTSKISADGSRKDFKMDSDAYTSKYIPLIHEVNNTAVNQFIANNKDIRKSLSNYSGSSDFWNFSRKSGYFGVYNKNTDTFDIYWFSYY